MEYLGCLWLLLKFFFFSFFVLHSMMVLAYRPNCDYDDIEAAFKSFVL